MTSDRRRSRDQSEQSGQVPAGWESTRLWSVSSC